MKFILILLIAIAGSLITNAQSSGSAVSGQQAKGRSQVKKSASQMRGSGQYHGSKDTTPGSPMGTGGAGGNEMSGSQAGSASETAIQVAKEKENVQTDDQTGSEGSKAMKSNTKKKKVVHKNKRM